MTDEDHKMRIQLAIDTLMARASDARRDGLEVQITKMIGPYTDSIMGPGGCYRMDFTVKRIKNI